MYSPVVEKYLDQYNLMGVRGLTGDPAGCQLRPGSAAGSPEGPDVPCCLLVTSLHSATWTRLSPCGPCLLPASALCPPPAVSKEMSRLRVRLFTHWLISPASGGRKAVSRTRDFQTVLVHTPETHNFRTSILPPSERAQEDETAKGYGDRTTSNSF